MAGLLTRRENPEKLPVVSFFRFPVIAALVALLALTGLAQEVHAMFKAETECAAQEHDNDATAHPDCTDCALDCCHTVSTIAFTLPARLNLERREAEATSFRSHTSWMPDGMPPAIEVPPQRA